jgi:hypothetical protein
MWSVTCSYDPVSRAPYAARGRAGPIESTAAREPPIMFKASNLTCLIRVHRRADSVAGDFWNCDSARSAPTMPHRKNAGHARRKERKEMKLFKAATMTCYAALIGAALAPIGQADDWNRKTEITLSGPVEIPGVHLAGWGVLPAGTYVFKILDSQSDRHIVQIFSKDERTIYATILAIPNYRLKATDKTVMTFSERPAGQPEALRAWFYPGRNWGEEFVYPKARAMELAKTANAPVLFTAVEIPLEVTAPIKSADEPVVVALKQAPIMAVQPTGEEVQLAEVVTPPPAETEVAVAELPATASTLPLFFLFGLLALGSALAVRGFAKRLQ